MSIECPIFVFEKDDHSMCLIENEERILYHLEAIDIANDEYVFWDAKGNGVRVNVSVGTFTSKVESVSSCLAAFPIDDAFKLFVQSLGVSESLANGSPTEIWDRIQKQSTHRGID